VKIRMKSLFAAAGITLVALTSQPVLAEGWGHHRGNAGHYRGGGNGWVPFALGAVVGGVAVGAMMQPQPVYVQPTYPPPPPWYARPRMIVSPPVVYAVPPPRVIYYEAY